MTTSRISPKRAQLCLLALFVSAYASIGAAAQFKYDGVWEGSLKREYRVRGTNSEMEPYTEPERAFNVRLTVANGRVSVHTGRDGEWREVIPNGFEMLQLDTNAVVVGILAGRDSDGIVVETWSLSMTAIDDTSVQVQWQRLVKNKAIDASDPDAVWGQVAHGKLKRVITPEVTRGRRTPR